MSAPTGYMTLAQAAKAYGISYEILAESVRAGFLKARVRRGTAKPYFVNEKIMEAWFEDGFEDAIDVIKRKEAEQRNVEVVAR